MTITKQGNNYISFLGPEEIKNFSEEKLADEIEKENAGDEDRLEGELVGSIAYKN